MSEAPGKSGPQFRADLPQEQEVVRTTIVGGRPPGSGQRLGPIPRGIEVLVRKASVDPEFKRALLAERAEASRRIDLTLDPAEAMMLAAVPDEQLETIIARTNVPQEHRRAFLGTAAAAMLAAVGLISSGCGGTTTTDVAPDDPTLDRYGRPKRDRMRGEGGAAPERPDDEPGSDGSTEPDTADKPDARPVLTFGIRPDRVSAPTDSHPNPEAGSAAPE